MNWKTPPHPFALAPATVHVWDATLAHSPAQINGLAETLSSDERHRAERFHFERDRSRYIAGRGILRTLLAAYLESEPASLLFQYGSHGKPSLARQQPAAPLHFNVSHSHDRLLVAITRETPVGVDIERLRPMSEVAEIAHQFFSPREVAALESLPEPLQAEAFFNLWTRKEACLKAIGTGLSDLLGQIEVSFLQDEPARILRPPAVPGKSVADWTLMALPTVPGYQAALAAPVPDLAVSCRTWSPGS